MWQWSKRRSRPLSERDQRWNAFVQLASEKWKQTAALNPVQRMAYMCFWYDAEVNNGGHGQYFDVFQEADVSEVASALETVGGEEIAANFRRAVREGDQDDYAQADDAFYAFEPSLGDRLMAYVEAHRSDIFA